MNQPPVFVDTHAHLQEPEFDADRPAVIERYRKAGVQWIVVPGTDLASSERAEHLAQQERDIFAAVGLHPEDCATAPPDYLDHLRELIALDGAKIVAIGEIGLDFKENTPDHTLQRRVFEEQLRLAAECRLPVIVHSRFSTEECLDLLEQFPGVRGVMHCFGGTTADAKRALKLGMYLSFTGNVTYHGTNAARDVLAACPMDRLLLETDCPYLAPVPERGKRNEPAFVVYTYQAASSLLGSDPDTLCCQVERNAEELFLQQRRSDHAREEEIHDHA